MAHLLAIEILRQAAESRSTRIIAMCSLATQGVVHPDRRLFKLTRTRLVQFLSKMDGRGLTLKVGLRKTTRREPDPAIINALTRLAERHEVGTDLTRIDISQLFDCGAQF